MSRKTPSKKKRPPKKAKGKKRFIEACCAIVQSGGRILITQRKADDTLALHWEFPGGKIESGESLETCLVREIKEELGLTVRIIYFFKMIEYEYEAFRIRLHFFRCIPVKGKARPIDCKELRWVHPRELGKYRFPPATSPIVGELMHTSREAY